MFYRQLFILLAFFLVPMPLGAANWVWVQSTSTDSYYVDMDSITHNNRQEDERAQYKLKAIDLNGTQYVSTEEIDITYKTIKMIDATVIHPDGTIDGPLSYETPPEAIKFGTISYVMYRQVFVPVWLGSEVTTKNDNNNPYIYTADDPSTYGSISYFLNIKHTAYLLDRTQNVINPDKILVSVTGVVDQATQHFFDDPNYIVGYNILYEFDLKNSTYRIVRLSEIPNNGIARTTINYIEDSTSAPPYKPINDKGVIKIFEFIASYIKYHNDIILKNNTY